MSIQQVKGSIGAKLQCITSESSSSSAVSQRRPEWFVNSLGGGKRSKDDSIYGGLSRSIETAVLNGFSNMGRFDFSRFGEVGNGSRDFEQAIRPPGRQAQFANCSI